MGTFIRHATVAVTNIKEFIEFYNSVKGTMDVLKKKAVTVNDNDMGMLKQHVVLLEKRLDLQDKIIDHLSNNVLPSLRRVIKAHDDAIDEMGTLAITNERMVMRIWKIIFPKAKTVKKPRTEKHPTQLTAMALTPGQFGIDEGRNDAR